MGNFTRWSYDKESMTCKEFAWGGCQGNENNFLSERECHLRCKDSARSRGKNSFYNIHGAYSALIQISAVSTESHCLCVSQCFIIALSLKIRNQFQLGNGATWRPIMVDATVVNCVGILTMRRRSATVSSTRVAEAIRTASKVIRRALPSALKCHRSLPHRCHSNRTR